MPTPKTASTSAAKATPPPKSSSSNHPLPLRDPYELKKEIDATLYQPWALQALAAGETTKKAEYCDRIYVAWWDGAMDSALTGKLPHPYVEDIEIQEDRSNFRNVYFSMRLNRFSQVRNSSIKQIDVKQKATFKFLSDTIPNPRSVFNIHSTDGCKQAAELAEKF